IRDVKKELVLIISTDKGLAGALNTNLFREAANFDQAKTVFVVTGKKARQFVARTKRELLADFELKDSPSFVETKAVSKFCTEKFLNREVDKVVMKDATDNANQFIKDRTLEYNKMRQAGITTELLEIATAQMALGG